ncbi:unnamed protein product [Mycena citricolor]|uniref:DUF914-domain-containing protein n=1 Tax=Mycena citricolor TaxID=2018698 RepID=A0AAD2K1N2_9AGAR|nr:unnamed protein product [Mycena citricolor]
MGSSDHDHKGALGEAGAPELLDEQSPDPIPQRPPIEYTSVRAFASSALRRFKSLWTRRFVLSLLAGQVVSLCITCTNVTTTELTNRHAKQLESPGDAKRVFLLCAVYRVHAVHNVSLCVLSVQLTVALIVISLADGFMGWLRMVLTDGWKYIILAACDFEGNYMVVKAYEYTDLLSCMLLDAWAIPVCMFFCWVYMRTKYERTQLLGVLICIAGLGLLVASDEHTAKDWTPASRGKGDAFMIAGATLYGFTNATEEFFVRKRPLYEVVGQLGMWATIISLCQASGLEHNLWKTASWNGATAGLIIAYTAGKSSLAMFILYTVAPLLYRMASSAYYNLSLLSSDWYGLIFGLGLYHYSPYWLYFIAFALVLVGLITYFWSSTPEQQGTLDPQMPYYITKSQTSSEETSQIV